MAFNPYPSYTAAGRFINNLNSLAESRSRGGGYGYGGPGLLDALSEIFSRVADYMWREPKPGQAIVAEDGQRFIVVRKGQGEDGQVFTVTPETSIPQTGYRLVTAQELTRADVRAYYHVAKDIPALDAEGQARFKYQPGTVLDSSFLPPDIIREPGAALALGDRTSVAATGTLADGRDYYVLNYFLYNVKILCLREAVDGDPRARVVPEARVNSAPQAPSPGAPAP